MKARGLVPPSRPFIMAQARDNAFSPCSGRSSSGAADSLRGTPDTRLTSFSLDDSVAKSVKSLQSLDMVSSDGPAGTSSVTGRHDFSSQLDKDPFVTPVRGTRLSPTASSFTPFADSDRQSTSDDVEPISATLSSDLGISRVLRISSTKAILVPELETWLTVSQSSIHPNFAVSKLEPLFRCRKRSPRPSIMATDDYFPMEHTSSFNLQMSEIPPSFMIVLNWPTRTRSPNSWSLRVC